MAAIDGMRAEAAWAWYKVLEKNDTNQFHLRGYVMSTDSGDRPSDKKDDLVVTPGGPRPRDRVHGVGPDETVRRNADGTYSVVPKEPPANVEESEEEKKKK